MTCPSCGVAVLPGYVRCPKCHGGLPRVSRSTLSPGGTAVPPRAGTPIVPIVLAVLAVGAIVGVIAWRFRGGSASPAAPAASAVTNDEATPPPTSVQPQNAPPSGREPTASSPAKPDPEAVARRLDRSLKRARLWSTVTVAGTRLEIRSTSCNDVNLARTVDGARAELHDAGIAKVRCIEMSGKIAFERGL